MIRCTKSKITRVSKRNIAAVSKSLKASIQKLKIVRLTLKIAQPMLKSAHSQKRQWRQLAESM